MRTHPLFILYLLRVAFILSSTACAPQPADSTPQPLTLIPFVTSTQNPSQTPEGLVAAETPLPSPTPFTYIVQTGDTISGIALKFGVSIDDLQAANPEISPNAMSVGTVLNIPSNPDNPSGEPTPTPASFSVQQIECYPTAAKGMWCFVLVHNDFSDFIENVSAQVTLVDSNNATLASQTALLPLNILPPNTSLPLAVFFPPDIPTNAKPQVQVLTAIRLLPNDERYLPATIHNTLVEVNAEGHSAQVSGLVLSQSQATDATQVWVAATAYDDDGRVVGVRRWESNTALPAGGSLPFEFMLSSIGGRIARVEFAVEARP
ncbi:MAG: LysM peptidoglycan-binding domain-containing protein [Anaerolineae bacterium]|nr:LysM peptidoglycan-binding domain-containing protein [Anaerolineae bacterium]MCI0610056.1 LysM peptidoglycan-binding domain-containing protein [Anaerolineae bacterium]